MSAVWTRSRVRRTSELLMLLAIADYADLNGRHAWVSLKTLARRGRCSERYVRQILERLEQMGEIAFERNTEGRRYVEQLPPPPWFIHIRCLSDAAAYRAGTRPLTLLYPSLFQAGRPRKQSEPQFRFPGEKSERQCTKIGTPVPISGHVPLLIRYLDPVFKEQGAAPPILTKARDPGAPFSLIVKLGHEAFDRLGNRANGADLDDYLKTRCHSLGIRPSPDVIAKAIEAARWQRQHRPSAS